VAALNRVPAGPTVQAFSFIRYNAGTHHNDRSLRLTSMQRSLSSLLRTTLVAAPFAAALAGCVVAPPPPPPAPPAHHPAYIHALTDLRDARWNLAHRPGDAAVSGQEDVAIVEIDAAINDAKTAAAYDGKNLNDHPQEDARLDHSGRLHHALELLHKAHNDIGQEEDNPSTRALRNSAEHHIDAAIQATTRAIQIVDQRS
jgi:hypothetical protein